MQSNLTDFLPVPVMLLDVIGIVHNKLVRLAWEGYYMLYNLCVQKYKFQPKKAVSASFHHLLTIVGWVSLWIISKVGEHRCNLCHVGHHIIWYTSNPPEKNYIKGSYSDRSYLLIDMIECWKSKVLLEAGSFMFAGALHFYVSFSSFGNWLLNFKYKVSANLAHGET